MRAAALAACALLAGCATATELHTPPQGVNTVLEGPIDAAPGHGLIVGDLNLPAGAPIPRHWHHGEEFIYVIGGSATLSRQGAPDLVLGPGQAFRVPPRTVHWGKAGPAGLRAVSSWVKVEGKPLREAAPE